MGEARSVIAQQCVDGTTSSTVEPSRKRVGGVHRQGSGTDLIQKRECCLHVVGITGTEERTGDRHHASPCAQSSTSVATIRLPRLLRLPPFQQSQRISDTTRENTNSLVKFEMQNSKCKMRNSKCKMHNCGDIPRRDARSCVSSLDIGRACYWIYD